VAGLSGAKTIAMPEFCYNGLSNAWAITIHKSQGLTFERAIIDAQAAFACGQVYVALSRCKSLEGIVLRSRISPASVKTDPVVKDFSDEAERNLPSESELQQAKRDFQSSVLEELFCFGSIQDRFEQLQSTIAQHSNTFPPLVQDQLRALAERAKAELLNVAEKFAPQLADYLGQEAMPESNEPLQLRIQKASTYFTEKISRLLQEANTLPTVADNQAVGSAFASQLRSLQLAFFVKRACFAGCSGGFTTEVYNVAKVNAELDFAKAIPLSSRTNLVVPKDVPHPMLYRQLLEWREQAAQRNGRPPVEVLPNASLPLEQTA